MPLTNVTRIILLGALTAFMAPVAAGASGSAPTADPWRYSITATTARLPEVDLDGGGRTSLSSHHLRAEAGRRMNAWSRVGVNLRYDVHDRDFVGAGGFGALEPWERTHQFGMSGSFTGHTPFGWSYGLRPFVSWSSETGRLESDAMSVGTSLAVVAAVSRDHRIGLGARVSRDLDDSIGVSPIVIVDWRINDYWKLGNPREANFSSPAGLELSYRPGGDWRLALATIYQSSEFRLDGEGVAPNGIGESSGILSYVRITRRWSDTLAVHAYLGAMFDGELTVERADGAEIAESKYDTAAVAALSVEGSF